MLLNPADIQAQPEEKIPKLLGRSTVIRGLEGLSVSG